ncbi:FtsX-like permease family protein [Clostridium sp. SHJSY1]|uniref:FtsX-like permease family protein n=1 Tax=Clostridium sp. SHJSY1 TaxID=2942483 RepID=UPI002875AB62|nr:FtsX-like permease family protein [Clostridium sp. SHJSY1]MDS0527454.1 FtsX-like permease family protein [Clostridium sp. SHJSY1]
MKINTFKQLFLDSMVSLKRNITLTISSIITISATLFIFGLFIMYLQSVDKNITNEGLARAFRYLKVAVVFFLTPISCILIVNELKMVVFSRKSEISIMKSIGATNWFIIWSFVMQGIVMGIIGAFIGNLSLFLLYGFTSDKIMDWISVLKLERADIIINSMLIPFIIAGIFIGAVGSMLALRKTLRNA